MGGRDELDQCSKPVCQTRSLQAARCPQGIFLRPSQYSGI